MSKHKIALDATLSLVLEVDADSVEEAIEKVEDAWSDNERFVSNYYNQYAECVDQSVYEENDEYVQGVPFDQVYY